MGCNCGKNKVSSSTNKIVKTQTQSISEQNNVLKRIIKHKAD